MNRDAAITAFLRAHGYGEAQVAPLAQDASFRRYLRISGGPRPAVPMDAPPPEDVRPFLRIQAHLAAIGLSVPAILAADPEAGLLLEEDLGDDLLSTMLDQVPGVPSHENPGLPPGSNRGTGLRSAAAAADGAEDKAGNRVNATHRHPRPCAEDQQRHFAVIRDTGAAIGPRHKAEDDDCRRLRPSFSTKDAFTRLPYDAGGDGDGVEASATVAALFDAAVDALIPLQRAAPPADLPAWGPTEMRDTALGTLFDWWWPTMFGAQAADAARADVAEALTAILAPLSAGPRCMVHRDFFAGNLLWLPDRAPPRRIGIIDFQGAAIGHPAYDLVSLVQDARRDIPAAIQERSIARYLGARPDLDPAAFGDAFAVCAAQRHLRVACQWVRLARRDRRPQYLAHGPRTWRLLGQALAHPAVAPLAAALDRWIPPTARGNPPGEPPA